MLYDPVNARVRGHLTQILVKLLMGSALWQIFTYAQSENKKKEKEKTDGEASFYYYHPLLCNDLLEDLRAAEGLDVYEKGN